MPRRLAQRFVFSAVAAGAVVLAAAAVAGRERLIEEYHLLRLRSADEATRLDAVERLAARQSARAVPHLLELVARERREAITVLRPCKRSLDIGPDGGIREIREHLRMTPVAHGIYRIGNAAWEPVRNAIPGQRRNTHSRTGGRGVVQFTDTSAILIEIERAWDATDCKVRKDRRGYQR